MKMTKQHWIIIGTFVGIFILWYFFMRKKPSTESKYEESGHGGGGGHGGHRGGGHGGGHRGGRGWGGRGWGYGGWGYGYPYPYLAENCPFDSVYDPRVGACVKIV